MKQTPGLQTAHKTILLVDDDAAILRIVSGLLVEDKYNVLVASSGRQAEIRLERPQIKVLLMSGFTGGMLVLNEGWHFLAKPFIPSQLRALIKGLIPSDEHSRF